MTILKNWPLLIVIIVCAAGLYYTANFFVFWQPMDKCFVNVNDDYLNGNKKTILKAVRELRQNDPVAYWNVCDYVDTIVEDQCPKLEGNNIVDNAANCYVSGSKTIFIKPEKTDNAAVSDARKKEIKRLAQLSRDFWLRAGAATK